MNLLKLSDASSGLQAENQVCYWQELWVLKHRFPQFCWSAALENSSSKFMMRLLSEECFLILTICDFCFDSVSMDMVCFCLTVLEAFCNWDMIQMLIKIYLMLPGHFLMFWKGEILAHVLIMLSYIHYDFQNIGRLKKAPRDRISAFLFQCFPFTWGYQIKQANTDRNKCNLFWSLPVSIKLFL